MEANSSLTNRHELVEICQRKIETGLDLLGATAVEDALQDNVRDTLISLREAGIKVWVLTGDKVETALNIALSCGHIPEDAGKYMITDCENEMQINGHLDAFEDEIRANSDMQFALLIDGPSLAIALKHAAIRFRFDIKLIIFEYCSNLKLKFVETLRFFAMLYFVVDLVLYRSVR